MFTSFCPMMHGFQMGSNDDWFSNGEQCCMIFKWGAMLHGFQMGSNDAWFSNGEQ